MIADPKSREFVRNFGGQWLSVRNFDNGTPPNPSFYKSYDNALRDSSKREPLEFCNEVLQKDLPITVFLDSDFLVINERLAKHYDIEGVEGDDFRRVPAPADGRRGGVLGMSGILTYLADGTRTLPVRRATWVLDTLWNQPVPPPPPNAGDLPGIKDKKPRSVRERTGLGIRVEEPLDPTRVPRNARKRVEILRGDWVKLVVVAARARDRQAEERAASDIDLARDAVGLVLAHIDRRMGRGA
jgi:hypothetical protein